MWNALENKERWEWMPVSSEAKLTFSPKYNIGQTQLYIHYCDCREGRASCEKTLISDRKLVDETSWINSLSEDNQPFIKFGFIFLGFRGMTSWLPLWQGTVHWAEWLRPRAVTWLTGRGCPSLPCMPSPSPQPGLCPFCALCLWGHAHAFVFWSAACFTQYHVCEVYLYYPIRFYCYTQWIIKWSGGEGGRISDPSRGCMGSKLFL